MRAVDEALSALVGTAPRALHGSLRATVDDLAITRYEVTREAATGDALAFTLELKKIRRASVARASWRSGAGSRRSSAGRSRRSRARPFS